jgi:hypothetical protein
MEYTTGDVYAGKLNQNAPTLLSSLAPHGHGVMTLKRYSGKVKPERELFRHPALEGELQGTWAGGNPTGFCRFVSASGLAIDGILEGWARCAPAIITQPTIELNDEMTPPPVAYLTGFIGSGKSTSENTLSIIALYGENRYMDPKGYSNLIEKTFAKIENIIDNPNTEPGHLVLNTSENSGPAVPASHLSEATQKNIKEYNRLTKIREWLNTNHLLSLLGPKQFICLTETIKKIKARTKDLASYDQIKSALDKLSAQAWFITLLNTKQSLDESKLPEQLASANLNNVIIGEDIKSLKEVFATQDIIDREEIRLLMDHPSFGKDTKNILDLAQFKNQRIDVIQEAIGQAELAGLLTGDKITAATAHSLNHSAVVILPDGSYYKGEISFPILGASPNESSIEITSPGIYYKADGTHIQITNQNELELNVTNRPNVITWHKS